MGNRQARGARARRQRAHSSPSKMGQGKGAAPTETGGTPAPEGAPAGGMPWFDAFVDNPALPGNVCGSKDLGASEGALCFDAACALPTAASFSCKAVDEPTV